MASAAPPIYKDQDFYVPAFKVKVGQKELREEMADVISVSYTDSLANIDSFDLVVNNWDEAAKAFDHKAFKYTEKRTFDPWKDVELWMGYIRNGKDERKRMLLGEITTLTPNFPSSGPPTLTVSGLNLFHRFRTKQDTRAFFEQQDTEIAKTLVDEIAAEVRKRVPNVQLKLNDKDYEANRKKEQKIPYLVMDNQYPIRFLMERARRIGYELSITEATEEGKRLVTFNFRPSKSVKQSVYTLEWGISLISFQPSLRTADQVAEVTVRGWDPKSKAKIEEKATRTDLLNEGVVQPTDLDLADPILGQKLEIICDRPIQNKEEAKRLASDKLRQIMQDMVEARGRTMGLPTLVAGTKVDIRKLGRFSGTYLLTSTTHVIGERGYTTDFTARMEKALPEGT